jgi:putative mycofactocin binding protein MftB
VHGSLDKGLDPMTCTRHDRFEEIMELSRIYRLNKGVQVRSEKFGLLFYNYRGPRLYFLPSKDLVEDDFFNGTRPLSELVSSVQARHAWPRQWIEKQLGKIMGQLEAKGLIHGESIC